MKIPTLMKLAALLGVAPRSQDPSIEMPAKGSRPSRGPAWYRAQNGIPDPWGGTPGETEPSAQQTKRRVRRWRFQEASVPFKITDSEDGPRTIRLPRKVRRAIARDTRPVRELQSAAVLAGLG